MGKDIIVVDIDGTLSIVGERVNCLKSDPPDWDTFYSRCGEDLPNKEIIALVRRLATCYYIVLCTGRRESCRETTGRWFRDNWFDVPYKMLMRKDGDFRHDTILKPELLEQEGVPLDRIALVLEERNSMVKKWREMGLICLQVAEGDF